MSIGTRLLGPCAEFPSGPESIAVDVGALIRRLILFDTYFLESYRLLEIPRLISAFGSSGLIALLQSGVLKIQCELVTIAHVGQTMMSDKRRRKGPLPLGSFELTVVKSAEPDKYLHDALQNVNQVGGLALKQAIKIKKGIVEALVNSPPHTGADTLANTRLDLTKPDLLRIAIVGAAQRIEGLELRSHDLVARVVTIDDEDFSVESNLGALTGLDEARIHSVLQAAISALANTNFRLEGMKIYNALSGVIDQDVAFLGEKLGFLLREIAPQAREQRFDRVIELAGLPDISTEADSHLIDVDQLLKIRQTRECSEFREWIQRLDGLSDKDVIERVRGISALLGGLVQSKEGKVVRLLVSSALGLIPGYGTALGVVAGALDMFVIDRVFQQSGPAAFVNSHYRSLFGANREVSLP
jgi:hypothetical protein